LVGDPHNRFANFLVLRGLLHRLHLNDVELLRAVEPEQCRLSLKDLHNQQASLSVNLLDRAFIENLNQPIETVQIKRDVAPPRIVVDLRQRAVERGIHLADSAAQFLADTARRAARQPFLQDEIITSVISLRVITHRLPRFALRSRSVIVARSSRVISTCAMSASRARARWGKPAPFTRRRELSRPTLPCQP